jgi:putative selenate reductase molybdopterin-binding subunit
MRITEEQMKIALQINGNEIKDEIVLSESLLSFLRRNGFFGAKFGGCKLGECGACTVLVDNAPINSCSLLAVQAIGHQIQTIESLGEHPEKGWKKSIGLSRIQQAFIDSGAIQCGYCSPAMVLAAKSLLDENPNPTELEIREAISGVLCRCTGYDKPVEAIKSLSTEYAKNGIPLDSNKKDLWSPQIESDLTPEKFKIIGKNETKTDAKKLIQGKPAFVADIEITGLLFAKVLHSPVAHAEIRSIDVEDAKKLPGVHAVLTWKDIPRVIYSTAGQSDPIPGPLDAFSLDKKVRFIGDRVAFVAAETEEIAEKAVSLIRVDYKVTEHF